MGEHPGIELTVARFSAAALKPNADDLAKDEEALAKYTRSEGGSAVHKYEETAVTDKIEVASAIKTLGRAKNLVVAGRSTPTTPLIERSDCPELGPVGSYLATPEFSATASVLVVQRYSLTIDSATYRHRQEAVEEDVEEAVVPVPVPVPVPSPNYYTPTRSAEPESSQQQQHGT
jgi:hypothetical protein